MTPEERRDAMRRLADELWNRGNLDVCDELFAAHCSFHDPSFPIDGVAGMKQQVAELRQAQPDLHMDVHDVLVDGDLTCARWTMGGTARNEFRGLPATGRSYVMTGMTFDKWEGDRIVEEWVNYDLLGALQQAGLIPETASPPSATE
ncbi:ester cyclase [Prauserella sp. PE36]|uniref:Ester cyclase n=2 Tax=Pseudonocardiaceae TaxID=2070 RepID=A0ABY2S4N8_9PSEU|nr:ester cyclase [Prauserella coralliicola]RBM11674.1 ester cyclase [Prauserella sp. PE36]TKG69773.1 ester cyclase [Prauserella endophytica]